jgi:hypothetical protein
MRLPPIPRMPGLPRRRRGLRWSVVTAAPAGEAGEQWGDTWFARDLVRALRSQGQQAKVVARGGAESQARDADDVVLVLRGLRKVTPRPGPATWMLWVISHPELVGADEAAAYDLVFAASNHWSRAGEFRAIPLLQATNPERFSPASGPPDAGDPILFVGSTRGEYRPIVRDAVACGAELAIYGVGWDAYLPADRIRGDFLPNAQLPAAYASAGIVLNDHWPDMAAEGFLSNRLFDAAATGTRIVSDPATGLGEVFGETVRVYRSPSELCDLIGPASAGAFPDRAARLELASRIAREHSFEARARALIAQAEQARRG